MTIAITEEILVNRRRAVNALLNDTGEQCFSALFDDYHEWNEETRRWETTKVRACAVGVLVREFFGIKDNEELEAYLDEHVEWEPYTEVANKLGIDNDPQRIYDTGEVTVRAIWRKNDREERSFAEIGNWLKGAFNL